MTLKDLDEIEAQIDATVPYYVPALITEIRRLKAVAAEATAAERARCVAIARERVCGNCKRGVGEPNPACSTAKRIAEIIKEG